MRNPFIIALAACMFTSSSWAAPVPMPLANDGKPHTFATDDDNFLMDGKPVKILCGEVHYPRVPREHWRDRFKKLRAMGMNTVGTYFFWNAHEKKPGEWDFSGNLDFIEFCKIAQEEGLWVIVRPGPYICGEWEFGGFPGWLLKEADTKVRSRDPRFMKPAMAYLEKICTMLAPLQYTKGGPIIMAQVENEYGSYGSDKEFVKQHLDVIRKCLPDVTPYTADGHQPSMLKNGPIKGIVPTMNFGTANPEKAFSDLRKVVPKSPKMCGEFWVGWFDHWGKPKANKSTEAFNKSLQWMLDNDCSISMFMIHGGTSFGFMNGANWAGGYNPDVTNYDYGSPISESGTLKPSFYAYRKSIQDYYGDSYKIPEPPAPQEFMTIPAISFKESAGMFDNLPKPVTQKNVVNMEALGQSLGFILYRTQVKGPIDGTLKLDKLQDRAHVYVDGVRQGSMNRMYKQNSCDISIPEGTHTLDIFVENLGRINFGRQLLDERKGLRGPVTLGNRELTGFDIYNLPCENIGGLNYSADAPAKDQPVFYRSSFTLDEPKDTYLDMRDGWKKGVVWVNGHNLGRYWFIGSQQALYCPLGFLKKGDNEIVVLDVDGGKGTVSGVKEAIYGNNPDPFHVVKRHYGTPVHPVHNQLVKEGQFKPGADWQQVRFDKPLKTRYIAIEALNAFDGKNHAAITELNFVDGNDNQLDREEWAVVYADSQETEAEDGQAPLVMDNQPTTYWHTQWKDTEGTPFPHIIVIDLGKEQVIGGFNYQPRQERENGRIRDYKVYASDKPFAKTK